MLPLGGGVESIFFLELGISSEKKSKKKKKCEGGKRAERERESKWEGGFRCCLFWKSLLMLWGGKKKGPAARKDADVGCYVPLVNVVEREAARIDLPFHLPLAPSSYIFFSFFLFCSSAFLPYLITSLPSNLPLEITQRLYRHTTRSKRKKVPPLLLLLRLFSSFWLVVFFSLLFCPLVDIA